MKLFSVMILFAVCSQLPVAAMASGDTNAEHLLLAAAEERQDRREERGRSDERQDRRDCRQEEGRVGKDKRDCKQEEVRDGVRGNRGGDDESDESEGSDDG